MGSYFIGLYFSAVFYIFIGLAMALKATAGGAVVGVQVGRRACRTWDHVLELEHGLRSKPAALLRVAK